MRAIARNIVLFFLFSLPFWNTSYGKELKIQFREVQNIVQNEQKNFPKCSLYDIECVKSIIKLMAKTDQEVIVKWRQVPHNKKTMEWAEKMDRFHINQMKHILSIYGWLTISKFGQETDQQAWLLVQHADHDPFFQAGCAFILEQLAPIGETNQKNFAYLYDRVARNFPKLGVRQKYGTQVTLNKDKFDLLPYVGTLDELNKRRKAVGLEPTEQYFKMLKTVYKKK